MPNASRRPSSPGTSGINRTQLRNSGARAQPAPMPAATVQAAAAIPTAPSLWRESVEVVVSVCAVLTGLIVLIAVGYVASDSAAVGRNLAESRAQRGSLICQDGRMVHGNGSLRDRIVEDAYFVCTEWRTLQSLEQEEAQRKR